MQRDTHLTFGEIYSSREALLIDVERIIDIALVEVTNEPIQLRFITPSCPIEEWYTDPTNFDYYIKQPEEHTPGLDYVSVSYCWKHSQSLDGLPPVPDYRITEPTGLVREVRCPPIIFHRAVQFAQHHRCPYIWIDQECIHQDDPRDIEQHLRIMDRVYSESKYTAAILSYSIDTEEKVEALIDFVYGEWDYTNYYPIERKIGIETLVELTQDPWFRRTWAFQEKHCAKALYILVPVYSPVLKHFLSEYIKDGYLYIKLSLLQRHLSASYLAIFGVAREIPLYHNQYTGMSRMNANPLDLYATQTSYTNDISFEIAKMAGICDNLVVADRISIIGNVHKFKWRLLSSRLDTGEWGLNVCLLALHVANMHWGRSSEGRRRGLFEGKGKEVMAWTFVEAARDFLGYYSTLVREGDAEILDPRFVFRRNSR